MKYIATIVFDHDAVDGQGIELAFKNAATVIEKAQDVKFEIAHLKVVLNGDTERPTLRTVQVLRPEVSNVNPR